MWFLTFTFTHDLNDVYTMPSLIVQTSLYKTGHPANGSSINVTIHPFTTQPIQIVSQEKVVHTFNFKNAWEGNDTIKLDDLKHVHHQAKETPPCKPFTFLCNFSKPFSN